MEQQNQSVLNFNYYLKIIIYFCGFGILFVKPFFSEYFHLSNFIFILLINLTLFLLIVLPSKSRNNLKLLKEEFYFFESFQHNKVFLTFLIITIIMSLAFDLLGLDKYRYIDIGFILINVFLWGVVFRLRIKFRY